MSEQQLVLQLDVTVAPIVEQTHHIGGLVEFEPTDVDSGSASAALRPWRLDPTTRSMGRAGVAAARAAIAAAPHPAERFKAASAVALAA